MILSLVFTRRLQEELERRLTVAGLPVDIAGKLLASPEFAVQYLLKVRL